jgi:enoyl-CoA hydratase/carnithine racemase
VHSGVSAVIVGVTSQPPEHAPADTLAAPWCDVVVPVGGDALEKIVARVESTPLAATALAVLLRGAEGRSLEEGLLVESACYSTLQAGPEFARWRESRPPRRHDPTAGEVVRIVRSGSELEIVLDRPDVRNALDARLRDGLLDALSIAVADPDISTVHLRGNGPDYSSGGDLDEFGTFPDPATAHLVRLTASIGRVLGDLADRVVVHLHGACFGSGIELPAFVTRVIAASDVRVALPELALGLIPGAGGTVSLPRRIGRHRTAQLALTGGTIDAATALDWGLVDQIDDAARPQR